MFGLDVVTLKTAFAWAVSSEVTGVLQWFGTLLAVIGIPLTYRQSWKAAVASEAAATAVTSYQMRSSSISVAHSYSHLELTRGLLLSSDYKAAQTVMSILKRDVMQTIAVLTRHVDRPENLPTARRNLRAIEVHISRASRADDTFNVQTLDNAINGLSDCLLDWETRFVAKTGQ